MMDFIRLHKCTIVWRTYQRDHVGHPSKLLAFADARINQVELKSSVQAETAAESNRFYIHH